MIRHSVVFKLKSSVHPEAVLSFLDAANELKHIPGVTNYNCFKQIGQKNNFQYGIFMDFTSMQAYNAYNDHPDHQAFVKKYWLKDVADFLELDFVAL